MWQHSGLYECSTNDLGSSKFAPHLERLYGGFKGQIHNYRSKLKCARHRWKSERVIFSGFRNYYRGKGRGRDRGVGNTKTDKETETSQSKGYWTLIKNEGNLLQARSSAHCQRTDTLRYHKNWRRSSTAWQSVRLPECTHFQHKITVPEIPARPYSKHRSLASQQMRS